MGDVFAFRLPVVVGEEVMIGDSVHVNVLWWFDRGSNEVGFMAFGVDREGTEQFLGLI